MSTIKLLLLMMLAMSARAGAASPQAVLGEWRGTSLCTNRQIAPACADEQVQYIFTTRSSGSDVVHVDARKLVGDTYQSMGEMDFQYAGAADEWFFVLDTPRAKARWAFRIVDGELAGTLVDQASGKQIRKVAAKRWRQ